MQQDVPMTAPASAPSPTPPSDRSANLRRIGFFMALIVGAVAAGAILRSVGGGATYKTPLLAIWVHLATVVPAVPLGAWLLWRKRKGDIAHRVGGRIWALIMVATAVDSFWICTITGGIGPIHLFSVLVLVQVPRAIWFARSGQIDRHLKAMRGTYFGLIAAGVIAMAPERMLWTLLFG